MSRLLAIQDFTQQMVDAISAVIDFDVAIIDDSISLVAGSGKYKNRIGYNYGKGSITQKLLSDDAFANQDFVLVQTPHFNDICKDCETRSDCDINAALICSINYSKKVVGTLSLFATNESQSETIVRKIDKLSCFLTKISALISSKIGEKEMHEQASFMDNKFTTVINSVNEGVVAFDEDGVITQCNKSGPKMLKKDLPQVLGQHITSIFPNLPKDISILEKNASNFELSCNENGKSHKTSFSGTMISFDQSSGRKGGLISFRCVAKVHNVILKNNGQPGTLVFDNIQGSSKAILDIKERMKRVAFTDSTILLYGESGTGKELFAQAVHNESHRGNGPFIPINCGAIPELLLESELFGYEEGAFTGAKRGGKPGKFELAHGGTIFLDEIGDMPLHLQVKLLRVLQEKKFERVGGVNSIWTDIRLVAATNRNLEEMIKLGQFRNDLYYRLSVIPFIIPPLRERDNDILTLARYFLEKFNTILRKDIEGFDRVVEQIIEGYGWPGNVRELENAIEYAVNIETDPVITVRRFPPRIVDAVLRVNLGDQRVETLENLERDAIIRALRHYGMNTVGKEKVARALGISLATLYRKMKEFEINIASISQNEKKTLSF